MDSSLIRVRPRRALLLKDHLMLDDMSSCSSNGFKSFPRKSQCCATVRFLHGTTFDSKHKRKQRKYLTDFDKTPSKSVLSAFRSVVVAAVKRLPFSAEKVPEKIKPGCSSLGRRISRKILQKSGFLKKKKEQKVAAGRYWKSFDQLMKEDSTHSDSSRDCQSNGWSGSYFTASEDCYSGNYCSKLNSDDVVKDGVGNDAVSTDSTTSNSDSSIASNTNPTKNNGSDEEKEQFSPVSVLDYPFADEDEVSSPFQHRVACMEGTKTKLMKKIQRFECLAEIEPVNLATRFALQSDSSDNESTGSLPPHYSSSIEDHIEVEEEDNENEAEQKASELLHQMKVNYFMSNPDLKLNEDKLLKDFFREKIMDRCANQEKQIEHESSFYEGLLEEAENWINMKRTREHITEWEVRKNREVYVEDMEIRGEWRTFHQEREEVALELENEFFAELMNEVLLMLDISLLR